MPLGASQQQQQQPPFPPQQQQPPQFQQQRPPQPFQPQQQQQMQPQQQQQGVRPPFNPAMQPRPQPGMSMARTAAAPSPGMTGVRPAPARPFPQQAGIPPSAGFGGAPQQLGALQPNPANQGRLSPRPPGQPGSVADIQSEIAGLDLQARQPSPAPGLGPDAGPAKTKRSARAYHTDAQAASAAAPGWNDAPSQPNPAPAPGNRRPPTESLSRVTSSTRPMTMPLSTRCPVNVTSSRQHRPLTTVL